MSNQKILETSLDDAVLSLRLNDPKTRNSLSNPMRDALCDAVQRASRDPEVKVVYLTGSGNSFCAGGNVENLRALKTPGDIHARFRNLGTWLLPLIRLEKPLIVGLNGKAIGGGMGLAILGDIVIASEEAELVSNFFKLGVVPDVALLYLLPRLIGLAKARNIFYANTTLSAKYAHELGLVTNVVSADDLDRVCRERAREFANGTHMALGLAKLLMARSFELDLDTMFLLEGLAQSVTMSDTEFHERLSAFLEKRSTLI